MQNFLKNIIVPYYTGISTEKGKQIIDGYVKLVLT